MARVDYLNRADLPREYRHLFDVDDTSPEDVVVNVHRAVANNPRILDAWSDWATTLYDEVGDRRWCELTILAVAAARGCHYVWHQHVPAALDVGLRRGDVRAIGREEFERFESDDRAILSYATAIATDSVDSDVHDDLAARVGDDRVVAIAFLASEYCRLARLVDALGVELESEFVGWRLENVE